MDVTANTDKRYQVFVSSTYRDLERPRAAVISMLLSLEAFPAGMELFPAADNDAWSLIEGVIADSDYYLLIIGGRYGSIDPTSGVSYTEMEYDLAVKLGKPVMAFLHGDPASLPAKDSEASEYGQQRLVAFRAKVEAAKHVKFWKTEDDLSAKVASTWHTFRRRSPAVGWIRADQATNNESLAALAKAQQEIGRLRDHIHRLQTEAPPGTDNLAQGDDPVDLTIQIRDSLYDIMAPLDPAPTPVQVVVRFTWHRIFGCLGARMMQEADADALRRALEELVYSDTLHQLKSALSDAGHGVRSVTPKDVLVSAEEFGTILLQFVALGLIQPSDSSRSVKDHTDYWVLTPYGNTMLRRIRALRRGDTALSPSREVHAEQDGNTGTGKAETKRRRPTRAKSL